MLEDNSVAEVVDVRSIPRSRHNPQFAQDSLSASLHAARVAYRWMPALGGRRSARKDSVNLGWRNSSFRGYADYMQTSEFSAAIEELIAIARDRQACVLCAEAVPWRCHRSLIADALTIRDIAVEHILCDAKGSSKRNPHALISFARVQGTRIWYPQEDSLFADVPPPER